MARIYSNENVPLPVVEQLRRLSHDVLTTLDAGNAGKALPDEAVLEFAVAQNRIITLNREAFYSTAFLEPGSSWHNRLFSRSGFHCASTSYS